MEHELRIRDVVLDPNARTVLRGGEPVELTLKEFELLQHLMRHAGKAVTRENIYTHLWDFADNSLSNTIDVHVKNVRRKLGHSDDEPFIRTVRGVGYKVAE